jgi:hypothetical protein
VADWVARTVLVSVLGIPASKFNDDRLACFRHLKNQIDASNPRQRGVLF